ncbi:MULTISPECIES: FecR family protein [Sphingobacterium]|uniref:FecR family protein n=1 Tax=Sphingobacterium TaxID=28453 RepID=UPI0013DD6B08|nr:MULTISPECIES: FecR family protein [unclassified Sphingobacterium]
MERKDIKQAYFVSELIVGYLCESLSEEQSQSLDAWLNESPSNRRVFEELTNPEFFQSYREAFKSVDTLVAHQKFKEKLILEANVVNTEENKKEDVTVLMAIRYKFQAWLQLPQIRLAAILCVLFIGLGFYFISKHSIPSVDNLLVNSTPVKSVSDLNSGVPLLTLEDGSVVELSRDHEGLAIDSGMITYSDGTAIAMSSQGTERKLVLSIPRGAKYQVLLADGTKVWLNSESTLTYPSSFKGYERRVMLEGEAYFEVAPLALTKDGQAKGRKQFIVETKGQETVVLGTHFNIKAYPSYNSTQTTLLEGSVRLKAIEEGKETPENPVEIRPGQQATLLCGRITVKEVEVATAVSWRDGILHFDNESVEQVLDQIKRRYDVEIEYQGERPTKRISGFTSKDGGLDETLSVIEKASAVKFKVEGRRVIVMK